MNQQAADQTRHEVENFVYIPDSIHDIGLSFGAVGVFATWLSHYQQGELMGIVQACGHNQTKVPEFAGWVRELIDSGVMPEKYKNIRMNQDLEDLACR